MRLEAFKAGEFDVSIENIAKAWARAYTGPHFTRNEIVKARFPHQNPSGMQGFAMNMRRPLFTDQRVRQALGLAFDFEWANPMLFYGEYTRSESYFSNSELAASGSPTPAEIALLAPYRAQLPATIWDEATPAPIAGTPERLRANLLAAQALLTAAGWQVRDGQLINAQGQSFRFEFLAASKVFERVIASYAHNLAKLGITLTMRTVDPSLYQQRLDHFDYDMTTVFYPMSNSPGNEMLEYFASASALHAGSLNYVGLQDPVVDALLQHFVHYRSRAELVTASRALDRVLRARYLVVPNWFLANHRVAYWKHFNYPTTLPTYYAAEDWIIHTWWERQ